MYLKKIITLCAAVLSLSLVSIGQTTPVTSVFTTALNQPGKIITAGQSSLLVAEGGSPSSNNGQISIVNRFTGEKRVLITGLPSSGPSGLKLRGRILNVTIGQGDGVIEGAGGTATPNLFPSSPLFASVLELTLPQDFEEPMTAFTLSPTDHYAIIKSSQMTLTNPEGKTLNVRLIAKLPDYRREPRPGLITNVRPSNPFGVEYAGGSLYVVDASFNQLYKINPNTGDYSTFAVFPPKPNPLPFGPPVSEAVPDSVRLFGNTLLVPYLIGFPFAAGNAEVRRVSLADGTHQTFFGNLTSAIDVLPVPLPANESRFFVLEFSADFLAQPQAPGRLKLISNDAVDGNTVITLLNNLITPTSMARDPETGDIFITEIFPGRIIRVSGTQSTNQQ